MVSSVMEGKENILITEELKIKINSRAYQTQRVVRCRKCGTTLLRYFQPENYIGQVRRKVVEINECDHFKVEQIPTWEIDYLFMSDDENAVNEAKRKIAELQNMSTFLVEANDVLVVVVPR